MDYNVTVIQRILPSYRTTFFSQLQNKLLISDSYFFLVYGQEISGTVPKTCFIKTAWSSSVVNKYYGLLGFNMVWQPVVKHIIKADLIIIEQSNALLINYFILFIRLFTKKKVAFWGHGRNMQSKSGFSFSEFIKKKMLRKVDWWFAYTELSVNLVRNTGFPEDQITNVQNAIDTGSFKKLLDDVTETELLAIKKELGIKDDNILLYCGGMYPDKKLGFLIQACTKLKVLLPDLHVILIGNGPDQYLIENQSVNSDWFHYLGSKFDGDRVPYFKMSKAMLMPGLVGLSIVDSFIAETPMFTTDIPIHSPEIDYLENGVNGIMTKFDVNEYVEKIYHYFLTKDMQARLIEGCKVSSKKYTLDNMVDNFSKGIIKCMEN